MENKREIIKLKQDNLLKIKDGLSAPSYNRKELRASIVHIGLGNFHRAHQAAYLDRLLESNVTKSGIYALNLIPDLLPLKSILSEQDCLYSHITKSSGGEEKLRISGSIIAYHNACDNMEKAIDILSDNSRSLISLTITEGAYYFIRKSGETDVKNPAIIDDLNNREDPKTALACLAAALNRRYKNGRQPLTIMSCDNIPSNGEVLRKGVMFFIKELYPEIYSWAAEQLSFPSSMVDRITPVSTRELIQELEQKYSIKDQWPVCSEDYCQWVLEDNFRTEIPNFAEAGVQLVKNVEPYELMKMRLLNGSHSAMAYPSQLLGIEMVHDGAKNPLIKSFIRNYFMEEVRQTLAPVEGIDLDLYMDTLIERFSNINIADTTARLAAEGSSKIPVFMMKSLCEAIRQKSPCSAMIFAVSAWAYYLNSGIKINDSNMALIAELKQLAKNAPKDFLVKAGMEDIHNDELEKTANILKTNMENIGNMGIKTAIEAEIAKYQ